MELSMKQNTYAVCSKFSELALRYPLDADLVLPDYCGDVQRILNCSVQPNLRAPTVTGDHISAEGELVIRLFYINEANRPDCFEHHVSFTVGSLVNNLPVGAVLSESCTMEYVNCRALSPRKVSVNGTALVQIDVLEKKDLSFVESAPTLEIQAKDVSCSGLCALAEKELDLSETFALPDDYPPIACLLRTSAFPVLQSKEAVNDKLLIKGVLQFEILYLAVDGTVCRLTHELPLNQLIDAPGVTPDGDTDVVLNLLALYAEPKRDGNDEPKLMELAAKLSAIVKGYEPRTVTVVTDCYATNGTLLPEFAEHSFPTRLSVLSISKKLQAAVNTGMENASLISAALVQSSTEAECKNGSVVFKSQATVSILLEGADKEMHYLERTCDLQTEEQTDCKEDHCFNLTSASLQTSHLQLEPKGTLQLTFIFNAQGVIQAEQKSNILTDAKLEESSECNHQSLVLSFSNEGETLWNIAKRYQTKVSLIQEENALQDDVLQEDRMLLIPCAT